MIWFTVKTISLASNIKMRRTNKRWKAKKYIYNFHVENKSVFGRTPS